VEIIKKINAMVWACVALTLISTSAGFVLGFIYGYITSL